MVSLDQTSTRKYQEKEEFVSGHSGTTAGEIFFLCLVIPIGLHLYYKLGAYHGVPQRGDTNNNRIALECIVIEFLTLLAPMLVVQTSLLPDLFGPMALLVGMLALASLVPSTTKNDQSTTSSSVRIKHHRRHLPFLSVHRSCVYILTTIAILAVDFPLFPRKFCKTEVSGYGWMDLGAASFVVIAGWTSALSTSEKDIAPSTSGLARKAFKKCAPLLLLGFIRLATNKGLEYQEHVSEYGVHWNFFFTLCCVEGLIVAWKNLKRRLGYHTTKSPLDSMFSLSMMVPYQLFLSRGGGQGFIENGDRRCNASYVEFLPAWLVSRFPSLCSAFVANREGFLGVVGYLSLRLLSEDVARVCLLPSRETLNQKDQFTMRNRRLLITSTTLWAAHLFLTEGFNIPNSRRSTNASFIIWSLSHNSSLLWLIHYVMEKVHASEHGDKTTPVILEAVNRFGLFVFLFSNILTGLINLSVDTLHSSNAKAVLVLAVYLALVCSSAVLLDRLFLKRKVN